MSSERYSNSDYHYGDKSLDYVQLEDYSDSNYNNNNDNGNNDNGKHNNENHPNSSKTALHQPHGRNIADNSHKDNAIPQRRLFSAQNRILRQSHSRLGASFGPNSANSVGFGSLNRLSPAFGSIGSAGKRSYSHGDSDDDIDEEGDDEGVFYSDDDDDIVTQNTHNDKNRDVVITILDGEEKNDLFGASGSEKERNSWRKNEKNDKNDDAKIPAPNSGLLKSRVTSPDGINTQVLLKNKGIVIDCNNNNNNNNNTLKYNNNTLKYNNNTLNKPLSKPPTVPVLTRYHKSQQYAVARYDGEFVDLIDNDNFGYQHTTKRIFSHKKQQIFWWLVTLSMLVFPISLVIAYRLPLVYDVANNNWDFSQKASLLIFFSFTLWAFCLITINSIICLCACCGRKSLWNTNYTNISTNDNKFSFWNFITKNQNQQKSSQKLQKSQKSQRGYKEIPKALLFSWRCCLPTSLLHQTRWISDDEFRYYNEVNEAAVPKMVLRLEKYSYDGDSTQIKILATKTLDIPISFYKDISPPNAALPPRAAVTKVNYYYGWEMAEEQEGALVFLKKLLIKRWADLYIMGQDNTTAQIHSRVIEEFSLIHLDDKDGKGLYPVPTSCKVLNEENDFIGVMFFFNTIIATFWFFLACFGPYMSYYYYTTGGEVDIQVVKAIEIGPVPDELKEYM